MFIAMKFTRCVNSPLTTVDGVKNIVMLVALKRIMKLKIEIFDFVGIFDQFLLVYCCIFLINLHDAYLHHLIPGGKNAQLSNA